MDSFCILNTNQSLGWEIEGLAGALLSALMVDYLSVFAGASEAAFVTSSFPAVCTPAMSYGHTLLMRRRSGREEATLHECLQAAPFRLCISGEEIGVNTTSL